MRRETTTSGLGWTTREEPLRAGERLEPGVLVAATKLHLGDFPGAIVEEALAAWGDATVTGSVAVCPHLQASFRSDALHVGVAHEPSDATELVRVVEPLLAFHRRLEAIVGPLACILLAIDFADAEHGSRTVEQAHHDLKLTAIERGLIPGEFGRALDGQGSTFTGIQTRRSRVGEYLVVRRLLRSDEKYMTTRVWRAAFERHFPSVRHASRTGVVSTAPVRPAAAPHS